MKPISKVDLLYDPGVLKPLTLLGKILENIAVSVPVTDDAQLFFI